MWRSLAVLLVTGASVAAAQPNTDEQLKLVVALFRHGIRPPIHDLNQNDPTQKNYYPRYAQNPWPKIGAWGEGAAWGNLTPHGTDVAAALGYEYGKYYLKRLPPGSKAFLWADGKDQRTQATAAALVADLTKAELPATTENAGDGVTDPLFHPFEAKCGTPEEMFLGQLANEISKDAQTWITRTFATPFRTLYDVLACQSGCSKLDQVTINSATGWTKAKPREKLIDWKGQFPYANTAAETFLLEYENGMDPGFDQSPVSTDQMLAMMPLHDAYFEKTQRAIYPAMVDASNLVREISRTLNRATGTCQRIPLGYAFAGFVGHDTNIAAVASLLRLHWSFRDAPGITARLPDNDLLPAGALVFELWTRGNEDIVRILYVAQGLDETRNCAYPKLPCHAFRIPVNEMTLNEFNEFTGRRYQKKFLSKCKAGGVQTCQ